MSVQDRNSRSSKPSLMTPTFWTIAVLLILAALGLRLATSLALFRFLHWATWAVWQAARLPLVLAYQETLPGCLPGIAIFWQLASKMAVCIGDILRFAAR